MSKQLHNQSQKKVPLWKNPFVVICAILIIWPISILLIHHYMIEYKDAFDGASALFSALAFGGVIIAIFLQQQELEDTRLVLTGQQQQLEHHTQAFKKQNFESTFFSLLNLHDAMLNSITYEIGDVEVAQGRDCFKHLFNRLKYFHKETIEHNTAPNDPQLIPIAYKKFYGERQASIGHYYRNLYNIVRFVKDSDIDDKWFYIRVVRAQLSVFELSLLFYNCLSAPGKGFKPLVEEFTLLKTIEDKDLIEPADRQYYKPTAFDR